MDDVDAFDQQRNRILLEQAGEYARGNDASDYSDDEEEVLALDDGDAHGGDSDDDDDEDDEDDEQEDEQDGDVEEDDEDAAAAWNDVYGGDDADGTEEALKQQKRHLQDLAMDDYVDEEVEEEWQRAKELLEKLSTVFSIRDAAEMATEDKLRLLKQMFPEFMPLVKEMVQLQPQLEQLEALPANDLVTAKIAALRSYLGTVSLYFALFVDNLAQGDLFTTMKDLPVMPMLLQAREVWRQALELPDEAVEPFDDDSLDHIEQEEVVDEDMEVPEEDEEMEMLEEEDDEDEDDLLEADEAEADTAEFTIDTTKQRTLPSVDKYATTVDDEDKQRRKKALSFYTSKIDKAQQRQAAHVDVGGDHDIPYKEREFERRQRLLEEARQRGLGGGDLGNDDDDGDDDMDQGDGQGEVGEDDYYDQVKQARDHKKQARKEAHVAAKQAMKEGKLAEVMELLGDDGKRAVNYQILKNKGLTPHRKKEYRNARVKKRKQYEKAKKKLKSTRAVYDADAARGPYEGEKTGIKKNLSRSVKLV